MENMLYILGVSGLKVMVSIVTAYMYTYIHTYIQCCAKAVSPCHLHIYCEFMCEHTLIEYVCKGLSG